MELTENQWEKIDVASRILLSLTIIIGIGYAVDTGAKIAEFQEQVENGNCSYLVDTGYIQTQELELNTTKNTAELEVDKLNN